MIQWPKPTQTTVDDEHIVFPLKFNNIYSCAIVIVSNYHRTEIDASYTILEIINEEYMITNCIRLNYINGYLYAIAIGY